MNNNRKLNQFLFVIQQAEHWMINEMSRERCNKPHWVVAKREELRPFNFLMKFNNLILKQRRNPRWSFLINKKQLRNNLNRSLVNWDRLTDIITFQLLS